MPLETSITRRMTARLKELGCHVEKTLGTMRGTKGRPDLSVIVPIPGALYGVPLRIEVKQPGKEPTPLQEKRLRDLQRVGCVALCSSSVEEVVACVRALQAGVDVDVRGRQP